MNRKSEETPLVTVLMPVYNSPDLFCSLKSVIEQNYRPLELIVVDDASDDFDEAGISAWLTETSAEIPIYFQILRNEQNLGTVKTMNRGLSAASGKYVFNLADDDAFYDRDVIREWVHSFMETGCPAITARRADCDETLKIILRISPDEKTVRCLNTCTPKELFEFLAKENTISGACTAWQLDALRELGGYDERYRQIEDYPAYLKLLRAGGKIGFLDRVVIRYRGGGGSAEGSSFSEDYEKDIILIHENEILPYCAHPASIRQKLRRWLRDVHFDRWYNRQKERCSDSKVCLFGFGLLADVVHPMRFFRSINLFQKGKENEYFNDSHSS